MDIGTNKGVWSLKILTDIKRKMIVLCMTVMLFTAVSVCICLPVSAAEDYSEGTQDIEGLLSNVEEKVSGALAQLDKDEVSEIFEFVKGKVSDGSLESEEGLKAAIKEGEEKFEVSIDESVARQIVDVMEMLEDMGFSREEIINKAQGLYQTYGADFLEHANEAFTEVVEEAVENAVTSFFDNLWKDIKSSVGNLFKSWF